MTTSWPRPDDQGTPAATDIYTEVARGGVLDMMTYGHRDSVLRDLARLDNIVNGARAVLVKELRDQGRTWADVGERLGVSRQAAHQTWGWVDQVSAEDLGISLNQA